MKLLQQINKQVIIIAEAGVNHNGNLHTAKQMVDIAKESGVDIIKFQIYKSENLVKKDTPKANYQSINTDNNESQLVMLKRLELSLDDHYTLFQYCKSKAIEYISSPFDLECIDTLLKFGVDAFKIPSGDITNFPYLRKIGQTNKPVIMSTGMAKLGEIESALDLLTSNGRPYSDIVLLHCNTEYPTPVEDVNLKAMLTIKSAFPGVHVGYSDHTLGIEISLAAVALGARIIEKHFTIDKNMKGPDHKSSLEPHELENLVRSIRNIERSMGNGLKKPSPSELKNITAVRKSIVASKKIETGEMFTEDNLCTKRPGYGKNPMHWEKIIGQKAKKTYFADDLI